MTVFLESFDNLLDSEADALVNTVNTVGIMGKGIALQFKNAFPANFKSYEKACKNGQVQLGSMFVFDAGQLMRPRWIINFPTKGHWRSNSRLGDVAAGLDDLRQVIERFGITSIAIPPLGCGNGGLDWNDVRPLILAKLANLDVSVTIFQPAGSPKAADMPIATERPVLTPGKAGLVAVIDRYRQVALGASLIEIQKLMYFLQESGEDLRLRYEAALYGPYADNLRHVLKALEGHHLQGYGDGSSKVREAESIELIDGAAAEALSELDANPAMVEHIDRVMSLVDGFESPYGLELLASVHWVATHHEDGPTNDLSEIIVRVQKWSRRKQRMFTEEHIEAAVERLRDHDWLAGAPAFA
jgi:O-acetyl-ADP-ribose deacetylase (regulator of RNase III)